MLESSPRPPETQVSFGAALHPNFGMMAARVSGPEGGPWAAVHTKPPATGNGADAAAAYFSSLPDPDQASGQDISTGSIDFSDIDFADNGESSYPADFNEWPRAKQHAYFAEEALRYRNFEELDRIFEEEAARAKAAALSREQRPAFPLIAWKDIAFDLEEECRVDGVFPLVGLACLYGGPSTVKTFVLLDLLARMARGGFWGGREVKQSPVVYIAEGGGGIKKRIAGLQKVAAEKGLPADIPFHLITVAPNLGTANGDYKKLVADIEATGVRPGAIAIDTTTQALGGADENGAGMDALVVNATALAAHFQSLIVLVHHTPVSDDDRLRGKGSLLGGLDVSILSKREKGSFVATLTIMKMRDQDETPSFTVTLARVVLGHTKKGREVSTLVIETVEAAGAAAKKTKSGKKLPPCAINAYPPCAMRSIKLGRLRRLQTTFREAGQLSPKSSGGNTQLSGP
jgi:hypothetical protein